MILSSISLVIAFGELHAQKNDDKEKVSDNYIAQSFFIEGKTLELQYNYQQAIEHYRTALKYDKSPGIYFAISSVYYNSGDFRKALLEINNALRLSPNNIKYLEHKAGIYLGLEDYHKAADLYERIIELDTNYTYGLYSLARMYQELKMPSKALEVYERITEMIGFDYDVLRRTYEIYYKYKEYDKCVEILENVLKIDPYDEANRQQAAALYMKLEKYEEAKKIYEELFTLNPDNKEIQTELVKIYFKGNESDKGFENFSGILGKDSLTFEEKLQVGEIYYNLISEDKTAIDVAENIFKNLVENYPQQWLPYFYLGGIDIVNKNEEGYKENFYKAIQVGDTIKDAFVQIGFTFYNRGNNEDAKAVYEKGLVIFPEDYRMNYLYGLVLQRLGNEPEAIRFFEKALVSSPNELTVLSTLALAYNGQKMYKKSEETYEKALMLDPENALLLNNYAYNLSERGVKLKKALAMAKVAIEKDPKNASYLDTIGWVYFKLGKYKSAKKYIEKSLSINGSSAVVLEHLGDVFKAMDDYNNAIKYWNKALEINPGNEQLIEKRNALKNTANK
ncbi:MAG: tetratricopeptide repeat protein [Ignavibacteria bacterium]|nr:tetratricopeptide repeat protein [Ignavibacteria bacterium]